jgi:hypothetical protein
VLALFDSARSHLRARAAYIEAALHAGGASVATIPVRKRLIATALVAGALLVVAQSIAHRIVTVGLGACDATGFGPCPSVLDLDHDNGVSDIVSTVVIAAAGIGAGVLGVRRWPHETAALALAALLLLVTFDDALHLEDNTRNVYGLVVVGTIVCGAVLTIRVAATVPSGARWLLLLGTALLALDAKAPFLYDQLMNRVGQPALVRGDLLYELGVVLDEAMELTGWALVAIGLWDAALSSPPADTLLGSGESTVGPQLEVGTTSSRSASRVTSDA